MKTALLICMLFAFSISAPAQKKFKAIVEANSAALLNVPAENRKSLSERLNLYIQYLKANDVEKLYAFAAERKKRGSTKDEFVKSAKVVTEGEILFFKIQRVSMADVDEYLDEPKPEPGEGDKWFVVGCAKIRDENGKVAKYEMGFDVWLTKGQWYINRGGRRLGDGGYQQCRY